MRGKKSKNDFDGKRMQGTGGGLDHKLRWQDYKW